MKKTGPPMVAGNGSDAGVVPVEGFQPSVAQAALLQEAMKPGKHRSNKALFTKAGVPERTFYRWQKIESFARLWRELPVKMLNASMPHMTAALVSEGTGGNVAAIKLAMLATKIIEPGGVSVHVGDNIEKQLNIKAGHLEVIERADNYAQFQIIQVAVRKAMTEAIDVEVVSETEDVPS